mgnify:CR=1 FL=1
MVTVRGTSTQKPTQSVTGRVRVTLIGLARAAIGATILARPASVLRMTGVDRVTAEKITWVARLAAIRVHETPRTWAEYRPG